MLRSSGCCPFLNVLEPLLEEGDDVVIVGDVVDVLAGAPRFHEPPATQQPELVGHRGLRQPEQLRQVAHRDLAVGERIEHANPRDIAQHFECLGQRGDRCTDRAGACSIEHMNACSYVHYSSDWGLGLAGD